MILQSLRDYYHRKAANADPARRLPAFGFEEKEIPFIVELTRDGHAVGIRDTRVVEGRNKVARRYLVPKGAKKTSGVSANLLWDTAEYALGVTIRNTSERVAEQHAAFIARIEGLSADAQARPGIQAVRVFLANTPADALSADPMWPEILEANPNVTFRCADASDLVCEDPVVAREAEIANVSPSNSGKVVCLVSAETVEPERLHTAIKGVWGAQSSGANIVSFNHEAFDSYGKVQGNNAPVGVEAAFAYTTALNHLLRRGSRQRIQVGDASTVFWAQREDEIEDAFSSIFGEGDNPDSRAEQVRALLEAVNAGKFAGDRGENLFFILGLAPNAARISVRFWHAAPLHEIAERIRGWFEDIDIVRGPGDPEHPSLFRLLSACAVQGKADNIPPNLGGDIMRAILEGLPFPALWLNSAVQRCRAEQRVTYLRAAGIRASLNRAIPRHSNEKEFLPMLDPENQGTAYRLGRLFAVLEKTQEEANPGLNATVRERYYGAASSTPVAVFTTLLRLKNHHIAKLANRGRAVNLERLIGEILESVSDFPAHLALPDQGRFALGYYHQRQAFYAKPHNQESTEEKL